MVAVDRFDPIDALGQLVVQEKDRIVRLWAKRLRYELHELELQGRDIRQPLEACVTQLGRLLVDRGDEAIRLWPEAIRAHGQRRYDQRFEAEDLARELKALQEVLLQLYARRNRRLEPEVAVLVAELIGEALASVEASYARVLRTEEVRFKEAAVMESILHHVDVGFLLAERDGTISYATPAVAKLTGLPVRMLLGTGPQQTLSTVLAQLNARHLDGRPFRVAEMPFARVLHGESDDHQEWMVIDHHPDGAEVVVEMEATPIWDEGPGSELAGVIQTLADRTESARKTRELSEAYDELRRLQARLLQRTRMQALGQLASGAAHALNNLLNVIRLRVTLLRKEFRPDHLDALDRTVKNISELIARLQEFAVTPPEEELVAADPNQVVREAVDLARPELTQAEPSVDVDATLEAQGRVRVDAPLFRELVVNLLLAARDRMPQGGRISVSLAEREGAVHLRIADTGPTYTDEERTRLFDPLKAGGRAAQLSILLAVGRDQARRWGGDLTCENRPHPESGGVFHLRLPLVRPEELPAPKPAPARRSQARRVLVVDDDLDNLRMMAEVLTEEGYEVKVASSGDDALRVYDAFQPDAGLLDALMPDMSGWELARLLRQRAPQMLLAMVTGADVRGQSRSNLAQVDAVFRKPIDVGALDDFLSQPPGMERTGEEMPAVH